MFCSPVIPVTTSDGWGDVVHSAPGSFSVFFRITCGISKAAFIPYFCNSLHVDFSFSFVHLVTFWRSLHCIFCCPWLHVLNYLLSPAHWTKYSIHITCITCIIALILSFGFRYVMLHDRSFYSITVEEFSAG